MSHKQHSMLCHASDAAISLISPVSKLLLCRPRLLMSEEPVCSAGRLLRLGVVTCRGLPTLHELREWFSGANARTGHKCATPQRLEGAVKWLTLKLA